MSTAGRPKSDDPKASMLGVRLSAGERALVEQAAALDGHGKASTWAREVLLAAAGRKVRVSGQK